MARQEIVERQVILVLKENKELKVSLVNVVMMGQLDLQEHRDYRGQMVR